MNDATSLALKVCLFTGIAVLIAGLVLSDWEGGDSILWIGLLILIASPFVGILTACLCLIAEKDWKWVKVAAVLTVLIIVFLIASLLRN